MHLHECAYCCLGWTILNIFVSSPGPTCQSKPPFPCLDDLSMDVSGMLTFHTIIVLLLVPLFMLLTVFMYLGAPILSEKYLKLSLSSC